MAGHVFDYSGWRPDPASLVAAGVVGVTRYLATPAHSWKVVTKPEYDRIRAAGLPIMLNWEETAGSWREGYNTGLLHGRTARAMARALGHPDERPIVQSVDTSCSPAELGTAVAYQQGFNDGGLCGPQGVYGTKFVIDEMARLGLVRVGWQTAARGWYGNRPDCAFASLIQLTSKSYGQFPPAAYDENDVRKPDWGQHPAPEEVDMATPEEYAAAAWARGLHDPADSNKLKTAEQMLGFARHDAYLANLNATSAAADVKALAEQMAAILEVSNQILAAIQGAEFPVTGTVHIGNT